MDVVKPWVSQMIECIGKIRAHIREEQCCREDYSLKAEHVIRDFAKQQ
jgi:hypothetical protein